jgi:type VI secretion system secreted protein VgrG
MSGCAIIAAMPEHLPTIGFEFESSTGTLPADLRVHRFRMSEAVSEPYAISLDLVTNEVDFAFEELLGHDAKVNLIRGEIERPVFGVVTAIDWLGISGGHLMLRLTVSPALALLDQQVHTRMFQDMSVLDILGQVLGTELGIYERSCEHGSVARGSSPRDYCVQYRESNLAFVSRLLEEEGIAYVFEHSEDEGKEILQLIDAPDQLKSARNIDDTDVFPIIIHNPDQADTESVQAIEWRRRLTSTGVLRRDFDWNTPTTLLSSESDTPDALGRTRRVYMHGQRRFTRDDLAERAADRKAALLLPGTRGFGRGNATDFHAGLKINVDGHELLERLTDRQLAQQLLHAAQLAFPSEQLAIAVDGPHVARAVVEAEHEQHSTTTVVAAAGQRDQLQRPNHARPSLADEPDRHTTSDLRQHPRGRAQAEPRIRTLTEADIDQPTMLGSCRATRELLDVHAPTLGRRDPPARGVRLMNEAEVLERGELVANRGRRPLEPSRPTQGP